tara:strand:+ start:4968 stop:5294 length:327 start_codon:yes stop_codon:yes gene_type:complete
MEITGKLIKKLKLESGTSKSGKEWQKQEIILNTGNEYNPEVCITAFGKDKIDSMNKLEIGMTVAILCNVYSSQWQGKYYNSIDGYLFTNQSNNPEVNNDFVTSDNDPF